MHACPCKGCDIRSSGCHGKCNKYKLWKKEVDHDRINRQSKQHNWWYNMPY